MKILVTDTETSGLPQFNEPSEGVNQPHICELAALLFDDKTRKLEAQYHAIIKQDGWDVDPEALAAHGITKERSMDEGVVEQVALAEFFELHLQADMTVAHNWQFDGRIYRIAIKRFGHGHTEEVLTQEERDVIADAFKSSPSYCTMKTCTPILNLPATEAMRKSGRGSWKKPPKLIEAYQHFFGEGFDGAHSALADAWACARVYFKLTHNVDIGKPS